MKRLLLLLHALLALTLVPAVEAQPESAYYGVSIGEFAYSDVAFGQTFNDSVDSWRLMLGYLLLEHFALEGSYGETSTVRDTASGSLPGSPELGIETEITNFLTFRVLGTLPFDNGLSLMAGFGFFVSSRTSSSASTAFRTSAARSATTGAGPRTTWARNTIGTALHCVSATRSSISTARPVPKKSR